MKKALTALLVIAALTGCATVTGTAPQEPQQAGDPIRSAVVCGLTLVDPDAYGGWMGACPGTDVDAQVIAQLCRERGLAVNEMHNEAVTRKGFLDACKAATKDMPGGSLFVLYVSGHGGQMTDASGDEEDGLDETLCLWDGEMSDDVLAELWQDIPQNIRVLYITDTCNSGTNYRYRPRTLAIPRNFKGQLIHYGGSADGKNSFGGPQGGTFTTALIDAWDQANTYKTWFTKAAALMPTDQVPYYAEYGNVADAFRNAPALSVTPAPEPPVVVVPDVPPEPVTDGLHWIGTLTADKGIEGILNSVRMDSSNIRLDYSVPFSKGALCVFVMRDGRLTGGRIEDLRPTEGKPTQKVKLQENFKGGYLGKGGYGREKIKPRHGETLYWCIASRSNKKRTPFVESIYP